MQVSGCLFITVILVGSRRRKAISKSVRFSSYVDSFYVASGFGETGQLNASTKTKSSGFDMT